MSHKKYFFVTKKKGLKKGGQNVPKCSKIFLALFWVLNDILWKLKVSTYLTQKKCRGFTETILNSSIFLIFFLNHWIYRGFSLKCFFVKMFIFWKKGPKKGVSKCTKMLENFFGMVLGPKWHFMEAESIYIPHTKKMPMLFLHTVKNSFYKGVLLVRVFQTKKKVIFRTKFGTFIFFPLLMGSQPYLQGISTLRRPFRKKFFLWFNLNQCKIYGDFLWKFLFFQK